MDIGNLSSGLFRILGGIKAVMPFAKAIGGSTIEKVMNLVTTATEVATNIKERIEEGVIVANSGDVEEINDVLRDLQQVNDNLADYIAKS